MRTIKFKTLLASIVAVLISVNANAYVAEVNGIYYKIVDNDEGALVVSSGAKYSGDVIIPSTITYNNLTYVVKGIDEVAFKDCTGLTSIVIPESVTTISHSAFQGCIRLTSVTIPESVTTIGNDMFRDCTNLTSVDLPEGMSFIPSNLFYGCVNLSSVIIPESVVSIRYSAFYRCSSLTSITIPSSVKEIGNDAFNGCSSLTSVNNPESVTGIGRYAFAGCSGLTSVTIPSRLNKISDGVFQDCLNLTSVTIPESVKSIGSYTFRNCSSLTSVSIPENVTSIGVSAFEGCYSLSSIVIPKGVTKIDISSFSGCIGLTSIIVDENNNVYDSRDNCNAIIISDTNTLILGCKSTTIPSSVSEINNRAFYKCSSLTSLTIPESVTSIGESAFFGCVGLTSVNIPKSVMNLESYTFQNCSSLTSITIPSNVASIGENVFAGCENLVSIQVEEGNEMFDSRDGCNAVIKTEDSKLIIGCKTTQIPRSVKSIGTGAFSSCPNLNSLVIPSTIEELDKKTFYDCSIRNIRCEGTIPIPLNYTLIFNDKTLYHSPLYVPVGAWDAYAYADVWFQFHTIREEAMTTEQISSGNAYMMMDANSFTYLVYDPVNECVKSVEYKGGLDGTNPYNNWQVEEVKGKKYLYNLGAKKFAVPSMNGMAFSLVDEIESIEMIDGRNGIVLDGRDDASWSFVVNNEMSGNQNLKETITAITMISEDQQVSESFDLQGRKQQNVQNGLNIIRMKNGTAKKVLVK